MVSGGWTISWPSYVTSITVFSPGGSIRTGIAAIVRSGKNILLFARNSINEVEEEEAGRTDCGTNGYCRHFRTGCCDSTVKDVDFGQNCSQRTDNRRKMVDVENTAVGYIVRFRCENFDFDVGPCNNPGYYRNMVSAAGLLR